MESEALKYYLKEVKDTNSEFEIEEHVQNEAEQAEEFLQKIGCEDLAKLHQDGKEIPENIVHLSLSQKHLTERQAQTVRSRIRTLNTTLRNRAPRRKQRQDVRDVAWNVETSSTGTRSRSATPDSLDLNEDLTSDEDQQLISLSDHSEASQKLKTKVKYTSSEPLQSKKFNKDKGDVAHLGSENVILKGYQPIKEYSTLPRPQRERSGSDPTTEVHLQPLDNYNSGLNLHQNLHNQLSRSQNNIDRKKNFSRVYINGDENNIVSFEGLITQNKISQLSTQLGGSFDAGVDIDAFTDIEYQYLKPILYVELVAIFDQHKIVFLKRKASTKCKGGTVFGVNLATLVMRDMKRPTDTFMVPEIFQSVLKQLNGRVHEDGILRLAGQKQKLELLCDDIEHKFFTNRNEAEELLANATVHELTGVLKKLLRELPDPIFTMELFDMFYKTSLIPNVEDRVRALNLLVLLLPMENRNTYKLLLQFLLNIIQNEQRNRMNLHNVAMISAPSLFPPRLLLPKDNNKLIVKQLSKEELAKQINGAAVCCCIMETMLRTGMKLWMIPNYLAQQAQEVQRRAQDRRDNKDKRIRYGKTKLARSSTQYEAGPINSPRIKRDLLI